MNRTGLVLVLCLAALLQGCYAIVPVVNFGTLNVDKEFGLMNRYENPAAAGNSKEATEPIRAGTKDNGKKTVKELLQ